MGRFLRRAGLPVGIVATQWYPVCTSDKDEIMKDTPIVLTLLAVFVMVMWLSLH
jgi:hypothetical protein